MPGTVDAVAVDAGSVDPDLAGSGTSSAEEPVQAPLVTTSVSDSDDDMDVGTGTDTGAGAGADAGAEAGSAAVAVASADPGSADLSDTDSDDEDPDVAPEPATLVRRVFGGWMRTQLQCAGCRAVRFSVEACTYLSLDLKHRERRDKSTSSEARRARQALAEAGAVSADLGPPTVEGCLRRLIAPQTVGGGAKDAGLTCDACQERHPHSKRDALATVPPVVCLHVKRFTQQWRSVQKEVVHQKSDRHVEFPLTGLDLGPFTESRTFFANEEEGPAATSATAAAAAATAEAAKWAEGASGASDAAASSWLDDSAARGPSASSAAAAPVPGRPRPPATADVSHLFDMFAMVTHSGSLSSGHYIAFVRARDSAAELARLRELAKGAPPRLAEAQEAERFLSALRGLPVGSERGARRSPSGCEPGTSSSAPVPAAVALAACDDGDDDDDDEPVNTAAHWIPSYTWYRVDDSRVQRVSDNLVREQQAFLLFYVRRDCAQALEQTEMQLAKSVVEH